jgi:hypothetical protein
MFAHVFAQLKQKQRNSQEGNAAGKQKHLANILELHAQNNLKELHNQGHEDYLTNLVFEDIERSDVEDIGSFGVVCSVDMGDKQLVKTKTKNQQHDGDEEDIYTAYDATYQICVKINLLYATKVVAHHLDKDFYDV